MILLCFEADLHYSSYVQQIEPDSSIQLRYINWSELTCTQIKRKLLIQLLKGNLAFTIKSKQCLVGVTISVTKGERNCLHCATALEMSAFQSLSRENICWVAFHASQNSAHWFFDNTFTPPKKLSALPAVTSWVQHREKAASGQSQRWNYSSCSNHRSECAWHPEELYFDGNWHTSVFLTNIGAAVAKNKVECIKNFVKP